VVRKKTKEQNVNTLQEITQGLLAGSTLGSSPLVDRQKSLLETTAFFTSL